MTDKTKPATPGATNVADVADFDAKLAAATGKVLVEFVQEDCVFCEEEAPAVDALALTCGNRATVLRVNVSKEKLKPLVERFKLEELGGTPTILYAENAAKLNAGKGVEVDPTQARRRLKCTVKW